MDLLTPHALTFRYKTHEGTRNPTQYSMRVQAFHQPSEGKQIAFFKYTSSSALPCDFLLFAVHIVVHILV